MHATIQDLLDSRPSHFIPFLSARPSGVPWSTSLVYLLLSCFMFSRVFKPPTGKIAAISFLAHLYPLPLGKVCLHLLRSVQILSSVHHTSLLHHIWINNMDVQPSLFWLLCFSICTLWIIDITVFPVLML